MKEIQTPHSGKKQIAAFDFDCTITTHDTLLPFLYFTAPFYKGFINSIKLLPIALGYKLGVIENHLAKEHLLKNFLRNKPLDWLQAQAEIFASDIIPSYLRLTAIERIRWHQQQGHYCVLVSAGLEIYLKPWAQTLGFDEVIATKLIVLPSGEISGQIEGQNCYGQEKVNRLITSLGSKDNFILYAYGDSRGDKELLALADFPYYRIMPNQL